MARPICVIIPRGKDCLVVLYHTVVQSNYCTRVFILFYFILFIYFIYLYFCSCCRWAMSSKHHVAPPRLMSSRFAVVLEGTRRIPRRAGNYRPPALGPPVAADEAFERGSPRVA